MVEIDEICFRARWARDADNEWGREWSRYIAAYERRSGRVVLQKLEVRHTKNRGQGGGGPLAPEELHAFIFRPNGSPLLRPGTIVHTDGASAYRDLDWSDEPAVRAPTSEDELRRLNGIGPRSWRFETYREVLEREAAERRDFRGRSPAWDGVL